MKNNYDGLLIYSEIQKDIQKNKTMIILSGFSFLLLLMVIIPMAISLFFGLFVFVDLPYYDYDFVDKTKCTKLFLLPYEIILIFYFIVMYFHDKKLHLTNKLHFQKAINFFLISIIITILPYIFTSHILLSLLYFIFFILTVYYLSMTYYDVTLNKSNSIHSHQYRSEDLGWMSSHGITDNPFSIKDDINRAKVFVQTSTLGFDFIIIFIHMIVKSIIFTVAIKSKKYIQEAARLFDLILEENLNGDYVKFSAQSKIILESINYLSFRDGDMVLHERGEEIERLAKTKEQK